MKRTSSIFIVFAIILLSTAGMWLYQSWRDGQDSVSTKDIKNAYVVKEKGDKLHLYSKEGEADYKVKEDFRDQEYRGIADVCIREGEVESIVCKPEIIRGKVLAVESGSVDVADYGTLPEEENCRWYAVKDKIASCSRDNLYIGQTDAEFVVAEGKICSVLFRGETEEEEESSEAQKQQRIRIILKTNDFSGYEHEVVKLRGTKKIYVREGKTQREHQPGELYEITAASMKEKRVTVTCEEGGRIELSSLKRGKGAPIYRGELEIVKAGDGLHIINELSMEEYLYGVIPSEMPAEYHPEALKAQAVCARSYAARHIKNNRLKEMGAHVDDSVSYQVYNNTREDERCNQAVDATKGQKVYYKDKIASTYFFSTSCGATTSAKDVDFSGKELPYLTGRLQEPDSQEGDKKERAKLVSGTFGNEDLFRKFLDQDRNVLDKTQPWYRWSTTISLGDIENNINTKIGGRCQAAGEKIQVRQPDGTYKPQQINGIGKLKKIKIKTRKSGGVVNMAVLVGTEATVRVYSEYNIRMLVFHENAIVKKNDGKCVSGMNMLPSGFFVMDKNGSSYDFRGGGFGHGTGMSQTGANELAQMGKSFTDILNYYFDGTVVK